MFERILVANRGEIACRVMRTARSMGVEVVAVHSEADRDAAHVAMADFAVHIGGSAPAESYLRGDRIIAAALETGCGAIHPGYGFLSENPGFVEAVEETGLVFIGPSAEAIQAMGLKDAAKRLMHEAGVPVVPGYHGADQDAALLAAEADTIGYPVLIKAVAGGGGKGMRLVEHPQSFAEALESARGEARTAFGNSDVLVEKYIQKPRHIEVQVFGDGTSALHLFERDCSLQRRHQKVIEEAPAPGMTPEMRAAMGDAAVRAAEAIGYAGAGIHRRWRGRPAPRRVLVHGDEHAASGRASGDRGDHRRGPGRVAVARGRRRGPARTTGGAGDHRSCGRGAALRRGCTQGVSARHRAAVAPGLSGRRARR
jgi:3-methylcrotonyl-CoA carboxylase alpha subunit